MPTSYPLYKDSVRNWVLQNIPLDAKILDVGAGCGTYSDLLRGYGYKMDAVEIWEPYIKKYNLKDKYDVVMEMDVLDVYAPTLQNYDMCILGDILEHLNIEDGQRLIKDISKHCKYFIVAIPYQMEQGEHEGNIHETHLQPDLTPDIMKQRYSDLELLYGNNFYGYYIKKKPKHEKAFVLYASDSYFDLVDACCRSIRNSNDIPILVYMLNSDKKVSVMNTITIRWDCDVIHLNKRKDFIDREDKQIYKLLIERPKIVQHALENYAEVVAYVDTDSVANVSINEMFDHFPRNSDYPYFVEGIYDYLIINGRGGAVTRDDLSGTLEAPACELFGIDQSVRKKYRQTGYFVAGQNCIEWLEEWAWMTQHPKILKDNGWYAPFNEESLANCLLWKKKQFNGLPYCYINGLYDKMEYRHQEYFMGEWKKVPLKSNHYFWHGEKNIENINKFMEYLVSL